MAKEKKITRKVIRDFRQKQPEELPNLLLERCEELFRYRMQHKTGRLSQTHLLKVNRREIARIKTLMTENLRKGNEKISAKEKGNTNK